MKKKLIRLTESDIHRIVRESVYRIVESQKNIIDLTKDDEERILNEIDYIDDGDFNFECQLDNGCVAEISGYLKTKGYKEDDYYNGTGGFAMTSKDGYINIVVYNPNTNEEYYVPSDFENKCYKTLIKPEY